MIDDTELLYRAVCRGDIQLNIDSEGCRHISSSAFNDRCRRPSVDRASRCPGGASDTRDRLAPGSGVLLLKTADVRAIVVRRGETGTCYRVDVEPVPVSGNPAHAEVIGRPPFDTDRVFGRVMQAMARLAAVILDPC